MVLSLILCLKKSLGLVDNHKSCLQLFPEPTAGILRHWRVQRGPCPLAQEV